MSIIILHTYQTSEEFPASKIRNSDGFLSHLIKELKEKKIILFIQKHIRTFFIVCK